MGLIYGAFAITLTVALFLNIIIKRPKNQMGIKSDAYTWSVVSIPYLLFFIVLIAYNAAPPVFVALFLVMSCAAYVWQFRVLEYKRKYVIAAVPGGIMTFVAAWTFMGSYLRMQRFNVYLPAVLVLATVCLMMAAYFFMRSDQEIQLKTVIGVLYGMMTVVKVMYLLYSISGEDIFFIGLFVLDFTLYIIISILVYLNSYYRSLLQETKESAYLFDLMRQGPGAMAVIDHIGDVVLMNNQMKDEIEEKGMTIHNLEDLFYYYGEGSKPDWYQKAMEGFKQGQGCILPIEEADGILRYFMCDVVPNHQNFHVIFHMADYPQQSFWNGEGRRSIDQLTRKRPERLLNQDFEKLVRASEEDAELEKVGMVLIKITNGQSIEERTGSELYKDFLSVLMQSIQGLEGIYNSTLQNNQSIVILTAKGSAEKIQKTVDSLYHQLTEVYQLDNLYINVEPDFGVAVYPDDGNSFGELFRSAKIAIARNTQGSDHVQFYAAGHSYLESDLEELEKPLRKAVENGALTLLFQPQVELETEAFRGFEALMRWHLADGRAISPNIFIPMAEDIGIIEEIGNWALGYAIEQAAEWQRDFGRKFTMSVNISSIQLEKDYFADNLKALLETYEYPAECLELEVTESKILKTSKEVYSSLTALKEMGVKIALDDFGTGYSSLDYLRWLPFDVLKIDKSFIDNLSDDSIEYAIVDSVIELVNKMNLETVAEGVENMEQLATLQNSNCTYIQGYLYSKPLTTFEAREILLGLE